LIFMYKNPPTAASKAHVARGRRLVTARSPNKQGSMGTPQRKEGGGES
jgi:hypothetical protein